MLLTLLFRLTLRLLPLCLLLCLVVPAVGGRSSVSPAQDEVWQRFGFAHCDLPCYVGIVPGKTTFRQSPVLLFSNLPAIDPRIFNSGTSINFWADNQRMSGSLRDEGGAAGELRLNTTMPLALFLPMLGAPDCIIVNTLDSPQRRVIVFWVRDYVSIGAVLDTGSRINANTSRILALWMRNVNPSDCARNDAVAWRGFMPLWAYRR